MERSIQVLRKHANSPLTVGYRTEVPKRDKNLGGKQVSQTAFRDVEKDAEEGLRVHLVRIQVADVEEPNSCRVLCDGSGHFLERLEARDESSRSLTDDLIVTIRSNYST